MKKKRLFIIIILLLALSAGIAIFLHFHNQPSHNPLSSDDSADDWSGEQELYNPQDDVPTIEIPGIVSLVFSPDETKQKVNFHNPKINSCLFRMTLYVDEKQYWQSGYVEPGKGFYEIELTEPVPVGSHEAYLLYECFKEDGTVLNGAHVIFSLTVGKYVFLLF
ncbi:MAG: tRNA (uracil-5-)-methyltransferase [Eubacteriales bacterium]|nr:tRNA (uracil-5-)-methyltransferase [Eubacteriales bacterium]